KFIDPSVAALDQFGSSVDISGSQLLVGAAGDDGVASDTGLTHLYEVVAPRLTVAPEVPVVTGSPVVIPITLDTTSLDVTSVVFSLDYDEACLSFDPTDADADGLPDAIQVALPAGFSALAFVDLADADGEIDLSLFANNPTTTTFADGVLATATFTATCASTPADPALAAVRFSDDPVASVGDAAAQSVVPLLFDGSAEVFSGQRGDCNGDALVDAADLTASQLEVIDGDGSFWGDVDSGSFLGSAVGCDANSDLTVDAGDLSCTARRLFGLACDDPTRAVSAADGPRLTVQESLVPAADTVTVRIHLDPGTASLNSVIFSLDYDEDRLVFEDGPGDVRFLGQGTLTAYYFQPADSGGEIDVVLGDLGGTPQIFSAGDIVEVDLRLLAPSPDPVRGAVLFGTDVPASYGDIHGRSVPGTANLDSVIFRDGF
ncbi:MAG: FG-GAP repeat protein, partial [Acidobacteriota bacterium]